MKANAYIYKVTIGMDGKGKNFQKSGSFGFSADTQQP